jgi:hypothetical protein
MFISGPSWSAVGSSARPLLSVRNGLNFGSVLLTLLPPCYRGYFEALARAPLVV